MKNIMNNKIKIFGVIVFALVVFVAPSQIFAVGCNSNNGYQPEGYNEWLQNQFWCIDGDGNNNGNNGNNGNNSSYLNVDTLTATNVYDDSATLRGQITSVVSNRSYVRYFQWGTSSSNLNNTFNLSGTTSNTGTFSLNLYSLNDDQTYYFRACARNVNNSNDFDCGSTRSFTTDFSDNNSGNNNNNSNDNYNGGSVLGATDGNILTTDATNVTATSATLNGLVTENNSSETVWFEYGPTVSLGFRTASKTIYAQQSIVSTTIYGLTPGKAYFFRLVSADGETGDFKAFITNSATVTSSVGTITTNNTGNQKPPTVKPVENTNTGEIIFETIQYLKVDIVAAYSDVRPGDNVPFEVVYENLSDKNLKDVIMVVDLPKEMSIADVGPGKAISSQKIEVRIPVLPAYTKGNFGVTAKVGEKTADETFLVTVVGANFEHPVERNNRMEVINSSIIRVSVLAPARSNQVAALGDFGLFPNTFLGWLILITMIVVLIYFSRKLYKEREEEKKKKEEAMQKDYPGLKIAK